MLGHMSVSAGAVDGDVDVDVVGNIIGLVTVDPAHPILGGQVRENRVRNHLVGVPVLDPVRESVSQKHTV